MWFLLPYKAKNTKAAAASHFAFRGNFVINHPAETAAVNTVTINNRHGGDKDCRGVDKSHTGRETSSIKNRFRPKPTKYGQIELKRRNFIIKTAVKMTAAP